MKKITFLSLFVLFLFTSFGYAQNDVIARGYYIKAKEAFAQDRYQPVLDYLHNAKKELGGTNPDILYLELESRFELNKTDPRIRELAAEFINSAHPDDDRLQKVSLIAIEHKELKDAAHKKEQDMYNRAVRTKSLNNLRTYIKTYPNNEKAGEINSLIAEKERDLYKRAKEENTTTAITQYLNSFPRGTYSSEMKSLLKAAKEEDHFRRATAQNDIDILNSYLLVYPNGKYAEKVNAALETAIFDKANRAFENENYSVARTYYRDYISSFPAGENRDFVDERLDAVQSELNAIQRKQERQKKIAQRSSLGYWMFTYGTDESYGVDLGELHLNSPSLYLTLNLNQDFVDVLFDSTDFDEELEEDIPEVDPETYVSFTLGLTQKIIYPLWAYAGGGARYSTYYESDVEEWTFFPEAGLHLRLGRSINIKSGAVFINGDHYYQFGFGFRI